MSLIIRFSIIIIFLIPSFKSEEECLIEECGESLDECYSSEVCGGALSQVYDVSVEQCTDFDFVKTALCGLNDQCAQQIITIASCFISNCYEGSNPEQNQQDEGQQHEENETNNDGECFVNECKIEMDLCFENEGCKHVITNADEYCGDNFQCLNQYYVDNVACDGYEGCTDLVIAAAHCYFQKCNDECISQHCHELLTVCINSECNTALELAYSGKCEEINCLDNDAQLEIMCDNQQICAADFDAVANCYYDNCYNYKGYGETECIAESGYHAYLDEYGNCCAGLDRVDCLWNLENSKCGWFYHQGEGYCYSWQGAESCGEFKQTAVMAAPLSCFFEDQDCFMDSCNEIIAECKKTEECAPALYRYIYEGVNDYTLCENSEECIQIFGQIIDCLNANCITSIQDNRKRRANKRSKQNGQQRNNKGQDGEEEENDEDETFNSTEEPLIIDMTDENEMENEDEDSNTEISEMKEKKVMMEQAATN